MASDPKKTPTSNPLMDLDEPSIEEMLELEERPPSTARPDYAPDKFAHDIESAGERMTSPPSATYEMLRDSCKARIAEEVPLDEEQIVRPSSRKHKVAPPRR